MRFTITLMLTLLALPARPQNTSGDPSQSVIKAPPPDRNPRMRIDQRVGQGSQPQKASHLGESGRTMGLGMEIGRFSLHSSFWVNLDSFLFEEALAPSQRTKRPSSIQRAPASPLSETDQQVWDAAVSYYRKNVIQRDHDDRRNELICMALSDADDRAPLNAEIPDAERTRVLNSAAQVYRKAWWEAHNAGNLFWMKSIEPLVVVLGPHMYSDLSRAYAAPWKEGSIRVEVTVYSDWFGAFTTDDDAGHVFIASTDPNYQGHAALEMLFHEASHTLVFPHEGSVGQALLRAAKKRGIEPPRDLWHVLIFYTTGEYAKKAYAAVSIRYDSPNDRGDLWNNGGSWTKLHDSAELYWQPYLDGTISLDQAADRMVESLDDSKASRF